MDGTKAALLNVANQFGVEIPKSVIMSNAALQEFIGIMSKAPAEMAAMTEKLASEFDKNLGSIFDKSRSKMKDNIDALEEEIDINLPKSWEREILLKASPEGIKKTVQEIGGILARTNVPIEDIGQVTDQIIEDIRTLIVDDPRLQEIGTKMINLLMNPPTSGGQTAVTDWWNQIIKYADLLGLKIDETTTIMSKFAGMSLKEVRNEIQGLWEDFDAASASAEELRAKMEEVRKVTFGSGGLRDDVMNALGVTTSAPSNAVVGKPRSNESPFGGAQTPDTPTKGTAGNVVPVTIDIKGFTAQTEQITTAFTDMMTTLFTDAAGIPEGIMAGIEPLSEMVGTLLLAIRDGAAGTWTLIISDAQGLTAGIGGAFQGALAPSQSALSSIRDAAASTWTTIISDAQGIINGIAAAFEGARSQSQPAISGLSKTLPVVQLCP